MKNILLIAVSILSLQCPAQNVLKIGTTGFVTVDGQNYARRMCQTYWQVYKGDTTMQLYLPNYGYITGQKCNKYLDGDNSNTPFASFAALRSWTNSHLEPNVDTTSGGGSPTGAAGGDLAGAYPNPTVPGTVHVARVAITSDQLLAIHTTPIELIPAPPVGSIILPVSFVWDYTFGTVAYSGANINLLIGGQAIATGTIAVLLGATSVLYQLVETGGNTTVVAAKVPLTDNSNLTLSSSANPISGDGTLVIQVLYKVLTR